MMLFLILAPYAAFATLMLVTSSVISLFVSAAICLAVVVHDIRHGRAIKMLGAGSALLFAALGIYVALVNSHLGGATVKLVVDIGILAIALTSIAIRRPFTLQYAREMVDAETAALPGFIRAGYVITWAWVAAFVLMVAANFLMIYVPSLPLWTGLAVVFAARNTAVYFTRWYPSHRRIKHVTAVSAE